MVHFPTEESFGMVVLEGLGRDLKFFGARMGGIVDIAKDMPGAELFAPDDWPGLTAAIARWIAGGHPRPTGAAALIRERYDPEAIARRHVEIYREIARHLIVNNLLQVHCIVTIQARHARLKHGSGNLICALPCPPDRILNRPCQSKVGRNVPGLC